MNAAAKLLNDGMSSRSWAVSIFIARMQFTTFFLIISILFTSLSIVYETNNYRTIHATLQQRMLERNQYHAEKAELLLEQSTGLMQSRILESAKNKLQMDIPNSQSLVIVSE